MSRDTQCQRILTLLLGRKGYQVTLPEILDLRIANYRARISELRDRGWDIQLRREARKSQASGTPHTGSIRNPSNSIYWSIPAHANQQRNPD